MFVPPYVWKRNVICYNSLAVLLQKHGTGLGFLQTHYYLYQNVCILMWVWGVGGHMSYIIKLVVSHINAVASSALLVSQL